MHHGATLTPLLWSQSPTLLLDQRFYYLFLFPLHYSLILRNYSKLSALGLSASTVAHNAHSSHRIYPAMPADRSSSPFRPKPLDWHLLSRHIRQRSRPVPKHLLRQRHLRCQPFCTAYTFPSQEWLRCTSNCHWCCVPSGLATFLHLPILVWYPESEWRLSEFAHCKTGYASVVQKAPRYGVDLWRYWSSTLFSIIVHC